MRDTQERISEMRNTRMFNRRHGMRVTIWLRRLANVACLQWSFYDSIMYMLRHM